MTIQPHMTQHELVDAEPLVSERATVIVKTGMDQRRDGEIREAVRRVLQADGREEWIDETVMGEQVEWSRLWDLVHEHNTGGKLEKMIRTLQERDERAYPSLISIEFDSDEVIDYVPGEYVTVHYRHVPRPYSIASSPNREHMEICVRRVPGGRLTSLLCDDLEAEERITVRGPFSGEFVGGEFLLQRPSKRDVVFLATGTGVAPFKSMIDYAFEEGFDQYEGSERDVWLFLGASWEDDLPYDGQFRDLDAEHPNFHYVPTLSREPLLTDWEGETDYVQRVFTKYLDANAVETDVLPTGVQPFVDAECRYDIHARIDPREAEVYACGINAMVYEIVSVAEAAGVPLDCIRGEGYG